MEYLFKFNQLRSAIKRASDLESISLSTGSEFQQSIISLPSSADRSQKIKALARNYSKSTKFIGQVKENKICAALLSALPVLQNYDPAVPPSITDQLKNLLGSEINLFVKKQEVLTTILNLKDSILTIKLLTELHPLPILEMADCLRVYHLLLTNASIQGFPTKNSEINSYLKSVISLPDGIISHSPKVTKRTSNNSKERLKSLAERYKEINQAVNELLSISPKNFAFTKQTKSELAYTPAELQPEALFQKELQIRNQIFGSMIKASADSIFNSQDGLGKIAGALPSIQQATKMSSLQSVMNNEIELPLSKNGKMAIVGRSAFLPQENKESSLILSAEGIKKLSPTTINLLTKEGLQPELPISYTVDKLVLEKKQLFEEAHSLVQSNTMNTVKRIGTTLVNIYSSPPAMVLTWYPDQILENYTEIVKPEFASIPATHSTMEPAGIIDLQMVRQQLKRYEAGEISHIENILKGESKERIYRTRLETETITTRETEIDTTTENSLETTDRFEMQREVKKALTEQTEVKGSLTVEGSYGPSFRFQATGEASWNRREEQSTSFSSTVGREVTQKTSEKVTERVLNRETKRILREIEDTNKHGFDNVAGDGHVTGMYQWIMKVYEAQVFNYGERTIYDIMIPEPGAMLLNAFQKRRTNAIEIIQPPALEIQPGHLTPENYQRFITLYGATDVVPPPQPFRVESYNFNTGGADKDQKFTNSTRIEIPDGYEAITATFGIVVMVWDGWVLDVILGQRDHRFEESNGWVWRTNLDRETGSVPMALTTHRISDGAVAIEVQCRRTERAIQLWQADTHAKLLDAYKTRMSEYEAKLAELEALAPPQIDSRSSQTNLNTINEEVKRACISILTEQHFDVFDAINTDSLSMPTIDFNEAHAEGKYIRFFEQAFEWENLSFITYPYFWGRKSGWLDKMSIRDDDQNFESFLRAGYVRVVLPVRRGFEAAVDHFRLFGEPWLGGPLPTISDDLYLPIADELAERLNRPGGEIPVGNAWEYRIPTSLVKLRKDTSLPSWVKQTDGTWLPQGE